MKAPGFWLRARPGFLAHLLRPIGAVYGAIVARRMARTGVQAAAPVITVGNFVAGGAGKTPTALAIARLLIARGETPAFVSRGYGGRAAHGGPPMRVDNQSAAEVGDEPLLLARVAPTFVGRDRAAAASFAIEQAQPTALILDDGLQSRRVEPDIVIAVVDGATGVGDGLCLPAGPLRAPLTRQLAHVSALIVVGRGEAGVHVAAAARARGIPVLQARLEPTAPPPELAGRSVVAFAGIGLPEKFFATVEGLGARIAARRVFADHHRYSARDVAALTGLARENDARLVTTEKDAVRLPRMAPAPVAIPVQLTFEDETAAAEIIARGLAQARRET